MFYPLPPPLDIPLLRSADRQRPSWNIPCDGGPRTNRRTISHFDGGYKLHVRSHKNPVTDDRLMLLEPIIITDDRSSADVHTLSKQRIADIGKMVGFGALTDDRFLHLHKVPDLCFCLDLA